MLAMIAFAFLPFLISCIGAACVPFTINLTWETGAPDGGAPREMILVNGTSPGPALVLDQGDCVTFTVNNGMPFASAVHFHGIAQLGTPYSDGTPGLSQRPIPSGGSFVYRWTADTYGTYFYHGHSRGQISNGLFGPIRISPKKSEPSPFQMISQDPLSVQAMKRAQANPQLVVVSDWTHVTAAQLQHIEAAADYDLYCTNSILVNGKGAVHCLPQEEYEKIAAPSTLLVLNGTKITDQGCSPPVPAAEGNFTHNPSALPPGVVYGCNQTTGSQEIFTVDPTAGWASFNFIGATALQSPIVSIDEHPMWVYEVDGRYITPQRVDGLQILNGERYAVMVQLNNTPADYTMRVANYGFNQIISGFATVSYTNGAPLGRNSTPYYSYSGLNLTSSVVTLNPATVAPYPPSKPASYANATHILNVGRENASHLWTLSGLARYPQHYQKEHPLLFYPNSPAAHNRSLVIRTQNNTWIDLVFVVTPSAAAPLQPPHPMHKHSNKAYVIGAGSGPFTWSSVAEAMQAQPGSFNLDTPPLRDSFVTAPAVMGPVWLAVRYYSMNPGAWLLHCHIQTHLAGGMAMAIMDGVDAFPEPPPGYGPGGNGVP